MQATSPQPGPVFGSTDASHVSAQRWMPHIAAAALVLLAGCQTVGTPAIRGNVATVIDTIRSDYIEVVDERALTDACAKALKLEIAVGTDAAQSRLRIEETIERAGAKNPKDADDLSGTCIRAMVGVLDKRSAYLDREDYRELQGHTPWGGTGVEIARIADGAIIVDALPGSPAEDAKIAAGDVLTHIDGQELRGRQLKEIVRLLRGEVGSSVTLTLRRPGATDAIQLTLQRAIVRMQSVVGQLLEPGVAYVRILRLAEAAASRLAGTLARLQREGGELRAIILDLRRNQGGLLRMVPAIAAAFLPEGKLVVEAVSRVPANNLVLRTIPTDYARRRDRAPLAGLPSQARTLPIAVLVDRVTASGAEAIAAALQDHKRAVVIGTPTFKLGLVQTVYPLPDNQGLKLTTATLIRPNGEAIEGKGITPDVILEMPAVSESGSLPRLWDSRGTVDVSDPFIARALAELKTGSAPRANP